MKKYIKTHQPLLSGKLTLDKIMIISLIEVKLAQERYYNIGKQTDILADRQADIQIDRHIVRQIDKERAKEEKK